MPSAPLLNPVRLSIGGKHGISVLLRWGGGLSLRCAVGKSCVASAAAAAHFPLCPRRPTGGTALLQLYLVGGIVASVSHVAYSHFRREGLGLGGRRRSSSGSFPWGSDSSSRFRSFLPGDPPGLGASGAVNAVIVLNTLIWPTRIVRPGHCPQTCPDSHYPPRATSRCLLKLPLALSTLSPRTAKRGPHVSLSRLGRFLSTSSSLCRPSSSEGLLCSVTCTWHTRAPPATSATQRTSVR